MLKSERFNLRASPSERATIEKAAKKSGDTVTRFILRAAIAAAKSVLAGK
jgi:uncharacterized protein (DUF1778 family)